VAAKKPFSVDVEKIIMILRQEVTGFKVPIVTEISRKARSPFDVLVSTVLSARTKDDVTREASRRLLSKGRTPEKLNRLNVAEIQKLIYPVGFYKTKAKNIKRLCKELIETYGGYVSDDLNELLKLPGVGRKTANLVLTLGFGKQGICVDTHVHRISNRLGYVKTKSPEETEMALRQKLPEEYWIEFNDLLVTYGQNVCRPISPFCSTCKICEYCRQVGVKRSR
jgi:endonuclease-3